MITRSQMRRQLRAKGGIMNVAPREKFLFGGLGDRLRKLIPNELANVAVKAAPFVAPFNPGIAAAMRGIGRYDQRGDFKDALKQGLGTYVGGQGLRMLGGAGPQQNFFGTAGDRFTSPLSSSRTTSLKNLFQKDKVKPFEETANAGKEIATESTKGLLETTTDKLFSKVPFQDKIPQLVKEQLLVGGITSAGTAIYNSLIEGYPDPEPGQDMTEYLAERKERVGSRMRSLFDNYFKFDPEYSAMTDEEKDAFVARNNLMSGGRAGYQTGGITMANTLAENMRRNVANQAAINQKLEQARAKIQRSPEQNYQSYLDLGGKEKLGPFDPVNTTYTSPIRESKPIQPPGGDVQPMLPTQPPPAQIQPMPIDAPTKPTYTYIHEEGYEVDGPGPNIGRIENPPETNPFAPGGPGAIMPPMRTDFSREINWQPGQPAPEGFKVEKMLGDEFLVPDDSQYMPPTKIIQPGGPADDMVFTKQPVAPDPNIPIEELIDGPMTNEEILAERELNPPSGGMDFSMPSYNDPLPQDQLLSGFEQFKKDNPEVMRGAGTAAMVPVTLPGGYSYDFSGSLEANAFRKYLESIGQAPYQKRAQPIESIGGGLAKLAVGGRVGFSDGSNLKIKLKEIGYEDTLLDTMSIKELRELLDSEKGTFTDSSVYRPGAAVGGIMNMPMGQPRVNQGGITELDYRAKGGFVPVGIKEKADDVPAMLSKNEFVFTADAVRGAGNGSVEKGAQKMYDTMKNLERRVT